MILWRRLDRPGHEACRLRGVGDGWRLEGTAVFEHENAPVRLAYEIDCTGGFETRLARVEGWIGDRDVRVDVARERAGRWLLNGEPQLQVEGSVDLDLNFSPSTNLLPIRRLNIAVGGSSVVRAAWLRFPSMRLEPLDQTYTRLSESRYRYESGSFTAEIEVNGEALPLEYAGVWVAESRD